MLTVRNVSNNPFYNQAFEEYVYETFRDDDVFLLWKNTPAVVVGSYQNICREVHVEALRQRGIPVVRRISGGGTVYHDLGNVNYTYIVRANGTVDYDAVLSPVIAALNAIGVPARKNRTCDIAIGDLKISGSAQRMIKGRLLHHGSLLFDTDIEQMVASTTVDSYKITSKSIKSVRDRVTNISEHLPAPMDAETFKETMARHIMNGSTDTYTVTPEDDARIREIAGEQFQSWERIFGRSPKFTIDRTGRFAGGKVQFKLDVQKGRIRDAAVYGDFFSTLDADTLCAALMGCPYERGAVLSVLRSRGIDGAVYRISAEELASVVVD